MKLADMLEQWRSDDLKAYVLLLGGKSTITRKADRIKFITQTLLDKASLRVFWQQMDGISRRAISVAFHNEGEFSQAAFAAQYGSLPPRPKKKDGWESYYLTDPILFDLFVIGGRIPDDLMPLLADLVLPPERFQIEGATEAPTQLELGGYVSDVTAVETELIGRTDLLTYLQLMEQDQLRFGNKNQRLTAASLRKVLANLVAEDFRGSSEKVTARTTIRRSLARRTRRRTRSLSGTRLRRTWRSPVRRLMSRTRTLGTR